MSNDTSNILALVTELATLIAPKIDTKTIELSAHVNCDALNSTDRLIVNTRRARSGGQLVQSAIHSFAHQIMTDTLPEQLTHYTNNRHSRAFEEIEDSLRKLLTSAYPHWVEEITQKLSLELQKTANSRPKHRQTAYNRVTLQCPEPSCRTTLTIRKTASEKVDVDCKAHKMRMLPKTQKKEE